MSVMDWERILSADVNQLANDEEAAEDYFELLSAADLDERDAEDPQLMMKLFHVCKVVLAVKGFQYEAALDEMEKFTQETLDERQRDMKLEIERLQAQVAEHNKFVGAGDKYYQQEIVQLEDRFESVRKAKDEVEGRLLKEQSMHDRLKVDMQSLDAEHQNMKRDLDQAHADIKDYQRQFSTQREKASGRTTEHAKEDLLKKNRELSEYLDEIKSLQAANDDLQTRVDNAKSELQQATQDMNAMANDYCKLKVVLEESDTVVEDMRKDRDLLRSQLQDMQIQFQSKADGEDQIMAALNEKVSEWKSIMASKDAEIRSKQQEIVELERKIQASNMDSDRKAMIELVDANVSKDEQIKQLKENLELATKDYHDVTDQIHTLKSKTKDGSPSVFQQKRIQKLNETIQEDQVRITKEKLRVNEAERDVAQQDNKIAELMNKIIQYESGQYGLAEAVKELKDCRAQVRVRDGNIEELTKEVNHLHIEVNDLGLENEEMRERLGLDSREDLDLVAIRKKKAIKGEQTIALNCVLQKEVEKLEEERVQLKKALRKQALDRGEKAVQLGLTAMDLEPSDDDPSPSPNKKQKSPEPLHTPVKKQSLFQADEKDNEHIISQNKKLEEEVKELKEENNQFELGLREINGAIRQGFDPAHTLQVPALDKLIAMIEQRNATGQYDTNLHLKGEIQHLSGRNGELRDELRNAQLEINKAIVQLDKRNQKIIDQEKEIDMMREANERVVKINPLPLPDGITPTSKEIIQCLNEYLIQILQELSNKEELCKQMENCVDEMRMKYSVASHQQGILYKEYFLLKQTTQDNEKLLQDERDELLLQKSQDGARIQEFDRLLLNLEACDNAPKKLLAELTRKITVLRVNEKSLTRRYTIIQEVEKHLRKDNAKIRTEILEMEAAVTSKIGDLERHKEMSCYKVTSLLKQLEDTVPSFELEMANKQFNDLTLKYRDLLQRENNLVGRSNAVEGLQAELAAFRQTDQTLKEKLHLEKEKSYVLQQTLDELLYKMGKDADGNPANIEEISSLARKLATLEMKELNEKERADHASMKYEQLRTLTAELEKRNSELEQKFAEIAKLNLESQRIERSLREQLEGCVPLEVNRTDKQLIHRLEEQEGGLKSECNKLKEIANISQHQAGAITLRQQSQEKELTSLRKQLYELQMETDEKTIIAKLHQHIVAMQVSESAAVRKFQVTSNKLSKKETQIMKLQTLLDEKDDALVHLRMETRSKARFLKKTIQDLRRQFSGALTLGAQERFSEVLRTVHEKKVEYDAKLKDIQLKHVAAEEQAVALKLKNEGLQELFATLKDGEGAKKVAEWHSRMGEIKLEDMKLKRKIESQKEKVSYMERVISRNESTVSMLENDLVKQAKEFEDRQLLWEQHEVELERTIGKLEGQQKELAQAARRFEEATGSIPDESLPLANQLETAIMSIKQHIKTIIVTRAEASRMQEMKEEMADKLRSAETALMQKEKIINELRLRLPFSERDITYEQAVEASNGLEENAVASHGLKVAQTTIDSLKLMLQKKDENLVKYQEMVKTAREQHKSQTERHQQEVKLLQDRLQLEIEEHVKKIKKVHQDYLNIPQRDVPTNKQIERLVEVEELLMEQDNALGAAAIKYDISQEDVKRITGQATHTVKMLKEMIETLKKDHEVELQNMNKTVQNMKSTLKEKELESEVLNQELDSAREANKRAPSKTMKNLVERLRDQLAKKDKEQKALSQALLQIRSDMVSNAEENVKAYATKVQDEMSIQILIEKETSQLKSRIDDLQIRVDKLKDELKRKKESESKLAAELETMTYEIQKKDTALKEVAAEMTSFQNMKLKCEKLKEENKKLLQRKTDLKERDDLLVKESSMEDVKKAAEEHPVKESKTKEEVSRWAENKKWQSKVESLKTKLKEKSEEYEKLSKTNAMVREGFARQEKEKLTLQNRLKNITKGIGPTDKYGMTMEQEETIAGLKQRIFQLEDENNNLTRQLSLDRDKEIQELRIQISQQHESIHALETQLLNKQKDEHPSEYKWSMEREKTLKKEMLEIRKENMELIFEKEQADKDGPRLKARVADLQGYVEVLKGEIETLEKRERTRKNAVGTGMGGQSVEDLERVISAMRRVVERLQVENDELKKQTGKSKPRVDLSKENRTLKQEIHKLKQSHTAELKKTNITDPRASARLVQENDKLCGELGREREEKEGMRVEKNNLEIRIQSLLVKIEEKDQVISHLQSEQPGVKTPIDFMKNKERLEETIQTLQNEIDKKNGILKDITVHLRSAAEREAGLLHQVEVLEEKVVFLQDFPPGVQTENDAAKFLQQARLQIKRLETDKQLLEFDLEKLRNQ